MSQIIFIYNAKGDIFSKATDFAHKIISPKTYACELCSLTYGNFAIEKKWKDFLNSLPYQKRFYYIDDWKNTEEFKNIELPAIILKETEEEAKVLVRKQEMQQMHTLEELIELVKNRLKVN